MLLLLEPKQNFESIRIRPGSMASSGFLGKLKQFDAYPKTLEDFRVKTYGGAASKFNTSIST